MKLLQKIGLAAAAAGTAASSYAVDITLSDDVQSTITSAQSAIMQVGQYLIVLAVVALAMRWIKGAFF